MSAASVRRWRALARVQGHARPKALGSDRRSGRVQAHKATILAELERVPDGIIEELRRALAEKGLVFGFGTLQRFLAPQDHAQERPRAAEQERREAWREDQSGLGPERLVFLDGEEDQ